MGLRWPFFKAILGKEERGFDVDFHCFKSSSGTERRILPALVSLDSSFPHFSTSTPRTPGHHELSASSPVCKGLLLTPSCYIHVLTPVRNLSWFLLLLLFVYLHNFISQADLVMLQEHNTKQCELEDLGVWFAAGLQLPLTWSISLMYYTFIIFYRTWAYICICSFFIAF